MIDESFSFGLNAARVAINLLPMKETGDTIFHTQSLQTCNPKVS